jgi:hypothetical protein
MLARLSINYSYPLFVVFDYEHVRRGDHALAMKFAPSVVNDDLHCLFANPVASGGGYRDGQLVYPA